MRARRRAMEKERAGFHEPVSRLDSHRFSKKRRLMPDFGGEEVVVAPQALTMTTKEKLKQIVARIERLNEEKAAIASDIKDVYGEAKATGFDAKVLRKVIALRKQDRRERAEQEQVMDLYLAALGDI
jgi:uncharacterized protein (UPF0335 family)